MAKITICSLYHPNPARFVSGPSLRRCRRHAHFSLTIEAGPEVYTVNCCQPCRDELVTKAENGATFEILDETELIKERSLA